MNKPNVKSLLPLFMVSSVAISSPAQAEAQSLWQTQTANKTIENLNTRRFTLDEVALTQQLIQTDFSQVAVPGPDGKLHTFTLTEAPIMPAKLAAKFPEIRAFIGVSVNNPALKGRFNYSHKGLSAMFDAPLNNQIERIFIDPVANTHNAYRSYKVTPEAQQAAQQRFIKLAPKIIDVNRVFAPTVRAQKTGLPDTTQDQITYRLAMTATGEYTLYHGGTVNDAMAEITIMVNRLNEIFQVELGVSFQLVENNDQLIFTDAQTDPFNNDSNDGDLNQEVTDNRIGSTNYDIGHIVNTNGGGLAVLGALCWDGFKADGITGSGTPTNDAFWVDFVAHELGHQFGANHTFNGTTSSCASGNREADAAYEVGSGTTIMSYAGICGEQNVSGQVDDYFHVHSLDEMAAEIQFARQNTPSCGIRVATQNNHPIADAGTDVTIPANTPFILTGTGTDTNTSDTLTYSWEQYDLGTATSSKLEDETDSGEGPLFRSLSPSNGPQRFLPKKINALQRLTSFGETLPTTTRELNFQFTVRDNQGGSASDIKTISVVDTGAAFTVTAPARNDFFTSNPITVNWNVAGTDQPPINCTTVNIELSNSTGATYPIMLAENAPNNGSASVTLPITNGEQRFQNIRVMCTDNIFYSPSEGVFSSNIPGAGSVNQAPVAVADSISTTTGSTINVSVLANDTDAENDALSLVSAVTAGTGSVSVVGNNVRYTSAADFTGAEVITYTVSDGINQSSGALTVTVNAAVTPTPTPTPTPSEGGGSSGGSMSFFALLSLLIVATRRGLHLKQDN